MIVFVILFLIGCFSEHEPCINCTTGPGKLNHYVLQTVLIINTSKLAHAAAKYIRDKHRSSYRKLQYISGLHCMVKPLATLTAVCMAYAP